MAAWPNCVLMEGQLSSRIWLFYSYMQRVPSVKEIQCQTTVEASETPLPLHLNDFFGRALADQIFKPWFVFSESTSPH